MKRELNQLGTYYRRCSNSESLGSQNQSKDSELEIRATFDPT
ncbi:unnamed protein product [Acidithrix sp. C25]|nr:unnamed protein product [Acidithrix sp. C25]